MAEAQIRVSSKGFVEWLAYEKLDPGEPTRSDLQAALICATLANVFRGKGRARKIEDFMIRFQAPKRVDPKTLHTKFLAWVVPHNARMKEMERRKKRHGSKSS